MYNYSTEAGAIQPQEAIDGLWTMMSYFPAGIALCGMVILAFYPLTTRRVNEIQSTLAARKAENQENQ